MMLAVVSPIIIGAVALSSDVAVLYFNWEQLQMAADTGAVAGASYLPSSPGQAVSTANSYVTVNGIAVGEILSTTVSGDQTSLNIKLQRTVPYTFGVLLGMTTATVSAQATARIETIGAATGVTPIGVDYRTAYTSGQVVTLMEGEVGPGNWSPLALGGTGASNLEQNIEYGYKGSISVGDMLTTQPGLKAGPIKSGFDYLLSEGQSVDPEGTFASHTPTDPRVLIVPMVDFSSINGQSQVPVKGFAALWLVSVDNKNDIETYFINQVAPGSTPDGNVSNFGAYQVVFIQ